jgi:hypothetical protein
MAIDLSALFGQQPDYSQLISPAEQQRLQSNAGQQALLNAAISALSMTGQTRQPISTGQVLAGALGAGMEGYNQSFDRSLKQMVTGIQLAEYKKKQQAQEQYQKMLKAAERPQNIPMATGQGSQLEMLMRPEFGGDMAQAETVSALQANLPRTVDPVAANAAALQFLAATDPAKYAELTAKQDNLPADIKSAMAFMQLTPEQKAAYEKIKTMSAPKTIVDMTGGQKGFENEMTLKKTFAAEPVYKAYSEMQSAYGQITDSLKQASPAGDLAAATKFMKLLDPGSVVRESELGMAMAASGALDRATNYAQMRINGTKLTADQRKDFQQLSDQLFGTATTAYNQKRGEFEQMGTAYGIDANRALGAPAKLPSKNIKVNY